jgi:hypothetical protein
MVAILIPIFWIGIYPESFLVKIRPAVVDLLHVMEARSAAAAPGGGEVASRAALRLAAAQQRGSR